MREEVFRNARVSGSSSIENNPVYGRTRSVLKKTISSYQFERGVERGVALMWTFRCSSMRTLWVPCTSIVWPATTSFMVVRNTR